MVTISLRAWCTVGFFLSSLGAVEGLGLASALTARMGRGLVWAWGVFIMGAAF